MTCDEARLLLDAYFDTELELETSLRIERHLAECESCSEALRHRHLLREELTPATLTVVDPADSDRLRAQIERQAGLAPARGLRWQAPVFVAAMAAVVVLAVILPPVLRNGAADARRELVDSHVRSLMENHLVDVPSSDRHNVKPWFQGRIDFAPNVPDLADHDFVLTGGRLDVIGGRPAAVIVYMRRKHYINLWMARSNDRDREPEFSVLDGYQVVRWNAAGLEHWVVSDINRGDLQEFAGLIRSR